MPVMGNFIMFIQSLIAQPVVKVEIDSLVGPNKLYYCSWGVLFQFRTWVAGLPELTIL